MNSGIPVVAPLFNVNDETVFVSKWLIADGDRVTAEQPVVCVETSKASVEIEAPADGYVKVAVQAGSDIPVGTPLCFVMDTPDAAIPASPPLAPNAENAVSKPNGIHMSKESRSERMPLRITPMARKIMDDHGIDPGQFQDRQIIRQKDVLAHVESHMNRVDIDRHATYRPNGPTRFSSRARHLIEVHGLTQDAFSGHGMVRASDIEAYLGTQPTGLVRSSDSSVNREASPEAPVGGVPFRSEVLPRRKRTEIQHLAAGDTNTLVSTIVRACPTRGLRAAIRTQNQIQGNTVAVIIYEAARLLRKYTAFNGFYADGNANYYNDINIGFAIDAGFGLKVPVIRCADRKAIAEIAGEMQDLTVDYLNDNLSVDSLSSGTFTITDLSGENVFTFNPLITSGQSAILGLGGEFFAPGSSEGLFNIILAFDHQMSEGRQAGQFLNELAGRLCDYEDSLRMDEPAKEPPCCARCMRTAIELERRSQYLQPTIRPDGSTRFLCSTCLAGF